VSKGVTPLKLPKNGNKKALQRISLKPQVVIVSSQKAIPEIGGISDRINDLTQNRPNCLSTIFFAISSTISAVTSTP